MSPQTLDWCMGRIQAAYTMGRARWSDAVGEVYADCLAALPDAIGREVVGRLCARREVPHVADIREAAAQARSKGRAGRTGEFVRDFSLPGYERQAAGVTPYALMCEGFLAKWSEMHPGQPIPPEWDAMFRRLDGKHGYMPAEADPFADIPGADPVRRVPTDPARTAEMAAEVRARQAAAEAAREEAA